VIEKFQNRIPIVGEDVYIAPSASVIGDVTIGARASIWHGAIVRGDVWKITIGAYSNIQDGCVCHVTTGGPELVVGNHVTIGHRAVLHSCTVGDSCLIGMGAVLLDGVCVGEGSIVAAGSVLLEGTEVPPASLVAGVPATVKKTVDDTALAMIIDRAEEYHRLALTYLGKGAFTLP